MNNIVLTVVLAVTALLLQGCLESSTTLLVKKDGSAIITDTTLMSARLQNMLKTFSKANSSVESSEFELNDDDDDANEENDADEMNDDVDEYEDEVEEQEEDAAFWSEEKLRNTAESFGPGVTLVSAVPFEKGTASGYIATYHVEDVNNIELNKNSAENKMKSTPKETDSSDIVTFTYKPGNLTIHNHWQADSPEDSEDEDEDKDSKLEQRAMVEMMQTMMRGLKFSVHVSVDGNIATTNAAYRRGSTVTLMAVDFDKIADAWESNPDLMDSFDMKGKPTKEKLAEFLKNYPAGALEVETSDKVTIKF